jgi:hypothetical protein
MAIMPQIAMGFQMPQIQLPNQGNMLMQVAQLESARQANELRRAQMAQLERAQEQENALLAMSPTDLQADPTAALRFGKPGRETYTALLAGERERRQAQLAEAQSIPKKIELMKFGLGAVNSPEQYASWREQTAKLLPGLAGVLPQEFTPETKRSMMLDADKLYKRVFESIDRGNVREVLALNEYGGGAPETVAVREVGARPQTPEQAEASRAAAEASRAQAGAATALATERATSLTAPRPVEMRLGNRVAMVDMNPNSPTYQQEVISRDVGAAPESETLLAQREAAIAASQAAGAASQARTAEIGARMSQAELAATAPKPVASNLGNRVVFFDMNPQSPTFGQRLTEAEVGAAPARPQTPEQQRLATAQAARLEGEVAGTLPARAQTPEQQRLAAAQAARLEGEVAGTLPARAQTSEQQRLAAAQAARLEGEVAGTLPARARTPEQQALDAARLESEKTRRDLDQLRLRTEQMRQEGTLPGDRLAQDRIANEQRRLEQAEARDRLAERRLNLAQEQAARAADPDFQFSISNARARGAATAKSDQEARDTLPNAIAAAQRTLDNINDMVGRPEVKDAQGRVVQPATKPHPGFENVVGFTYLPGLRFVPGTAAADFDARFKQVQGQAFLQAYEILRGGGHITEAEGTKGTAAINRMGLAQSEREFIAAARELQEVVEAGVKRARGRLNAASGTESTGRGSAGGGVAPAPAPTTPRVVDFGDLR